MGTRWVALDVGETLIDETRIWSVWADLIGVPRLTLMAALGAEVASAGHHQNAFEIVGKPNWQDLWPRFEEVYAGFRADDLYPDALGAVGDLCKAGYRVAIVANQPAARTAELRALGFEPDIMVMSDEMGVYKPDPAFFLRALELMQVTEPGSVAYVGDRVDNDVAPAAALGIRPIWLRRGPWGVIQQLPDDLVPRTLVVDSLAELVARIGEGWD